MSKNLNYNILLPKNNIAFNRLLQGNPELINNYVDELVSLNGGAYIESFGKEDILKIIQTENIIDNRIETIALLNSVFIGIN